MKTTNFSHCTLLLALLSAAPLAAQKQKVQPPVASAPQKALQTDLQPAAEIYPIPTYDYYLKHFGAGLAQTAIATGINAISQDHPITWCAGVIVNCYLNYKTPLWTDKYLLKHDTNYTVKQNIIRMIIPFQIGNYIVQQQKHAESLAAAQQNSLQNLSNSWKKLSELTKK